MGKRVGVEKFGVEGIGVKAMDATTVQRVGLRSMRR